MLDWSLFLECHCIRNVVLPLVVCYFAIRFCWFLWTQVKTFVIYASKPAFDFVAAADGGFALITGGAGGIGRSCAIEFAKMGINLFLVDYSADLLPKTVAEIKKINPKIQIKSKIMDLTKLMTDKSAYEEFKNELDSEKIGILFNNAGIAETKLFNYSESSYEEITNLVKINIGVPALLDRIVLPQMLKRKNGLIMNMGSASAKTPVGLLPLYGSSKSGYTKDKHF
ncbi:Oidioi.mRNA.OKI2018_I69.PAR.g12864.t1.cds [Oikopleura dioica]|uniref:Oidioi.mRNA.OKI2018_I69.PAR.g12864.t1.cds n=1 Tax=Oikopleura dioica TaxID=34765 RepID=A0ABN7S885_OIKDI|nr:Oidioi.mRNA.OKI2018_I69.PAR.g12864.t1.cds [Oikopleura dioica]